jgi:hypothetical protein
MDGCDFGGEEEEEEKRQNCWKGGTKGMLSFT